jgi:outer membrane protein OmpA-like peptidoglycan-associated protein
VRVATYSIFGGFLALGCLGFVCVQREAPRIERNLRDEALAAVAVGESDWVRLDVTGRDLALGGSPPSIAERDRVLELARSTPGIRRVEDFTAVALAAAEPSPTPEPSFTSSSSRGQAEACQRQLDALLADEVIHFEVLSAAISPASRPLLDELANALAQCPDARIEIGGHTDGDGIADLNMKLSEARAESVRNFLIHKGIDAARLIAVGHGATQPVADDLAEDGRQKNRRIEFQVQGIES